MNIMDIGITNGNFINMVPKMANRHGLVTGATGTGKSVCINTIINNNSDIPFTFRSKTERIIIIKSSFYKCVISINIER